MININFIEAKAELVLKELSGKIPVDIYECANFLGIQIKELDLEEDVSGFFVHKNGQSYIGCNKSQHLARKRFTIAHEIGHYTLHFNEDNILFIDKYKPGPTSVKFNRDFHSSTGENIEEREANAFAASLLMPRTQFANRFFQYQQECNTLSQIVSKLAKDFEVSEQAATIRINKLGLIDFAGY